MGESLFRRNPIGEFVSTLQGRKSISSANTSYTQFVNGKAGVVRNPAAVTVTGKTFKCKGEQEKGGDVGSVSIGTTLPLATKNILDMYRNSSHKPYPTLQRIVVEYGGDFKLAQKISGTIECYTKSDFSVIYQYFLLPGNEISVTFGSAVRGTGFKWNPSNSATLENFKVAVFSFSATAQGTWICNFTGVSSATALKNTDIRTLLKTSCVYKTAGIHDGETTHQVYGVLELIESDAQRNGQFAMDQIKDGAIIDKFQDYSPGDVTSNEAAMVVYDGKHITRPTKTVTQAFIPSFLTSTNQEDANQVYVTLSYVINRIFNDKLLRAYADVCIGSNDKSKFKQLKFEFHDKYSFGKVDPNYGMSGDPTSVLLLGANKLFGNYKNNDGDGKDFKEKLHGSKAKVMAVDGSGMVDLKKILIHRKIIEHALSSSTTKRNNSAESMDVVNNNDEVINIVDFFDSISNSIFDCTGGGISLGLAESPADPSSKYSKMTRYIVVDNNYGGKSDLKCVVFNPINGDGSTRSCELSSNVGSDEYRVAMFVGNTKKGETGSILRGCVSELKNVRTQSYQTAMGAIIKVIEAPGILGKSNYDEKHIDGLKGAVRTLHANCPATADEQVTRFPGMSINLTIDGTWGILPGCAISSTQVLNSWAKDGIYFMVTSVTHTIENSDWSTSVTGIMSRYKKLTLITL